MIVIHGVKELKNTLEPIKSYEGKWGFNAKGKFYRHRNLACLLTASSMLIGCSPSVNQPVSKSLPYADSTTQDETRTAYRATRPIPVVIKPAQSFRVAKLDQQLLTKSLAKNDILCYG